MKTAAALARAARAIARSLTQAVEQAMEDVLAAAAPQPQVRPVPVRARNGRR